MADASTGIVIDQAVAVIGVLAAICSYLIKQWWEEAKRISLRREEVYLRFGNKSGALEAALVLGNDEQVHQLFSELSSMVVEFQVLASPEVDRAAGTYMGAVAKKISAAATTADGTPISIDGLLAPREALVSLMRRDVTWLGRPRLSIKP